MNAPSPRPVRRWRRIVSFLAAATVVAYLGAATAMWAYYRYSRHVPDVQWLDIAVCPRFGRVQQAVGAQYLTQARDKWKAGDYAKAVFLARAAVAKRPGDPEARLFLADCWRQVGRIEFACRTLEDGLASDTSALPLTRALISVDLEGDRHGDLLKLLRETLPALGLKPSAADLIYFQHAEVQALFATEGADAAAAMAEKCDALQQLPAAAPLLARIDLSRHRPEAALARLQAAVEREPGNAAIHDALVGLALEAGRTDEASTAAVRFAAAFPSLPAAELRLLEIHGSRVMADRTPWLASCMRFLARFREQPGALEQLADLAARKGWSDLAFLLYQEAVGSGARDRAFATYYVCSLLSCHDFARADTVWRDLTAQKSAQADSAPALAAMVASGAGREGEALEHLERLRHDTVGDTRRRDRLARLFRSFGFEPLADAFTAPGA